MSIDVDIQGVESIRILADKLGKIPLELRTKLRPTVLQAARLIAEKAKANASWSTRIPGAITPGSSFTRNAGAIVRVNRTKAPHARPYEGIGQRGDTFRHPVFGNTDVWVTEGTRSFLVPAVQSEKTQAASLIAAAVRDVTTL